MFGSVLQAFLFTTAVLAVTSTKATAADLNLGPLAPAENSAQNLCERLLDADLGGYYVATDLQSGKSTLLQLSAIGNRGAYSINSVRAHLSPFGVRPFEMSRAGMGWKVSGDQETRLDLLGLDREGGELRFHFDYAANQTDAPIVGVPHKEAGDVAGDVLRPDGWTVHLGKPINSDVRFTRFRPNRAFETITTQSLKSLLATKLDEEEPSATDFVLLVEMKRPMTEADACRLLEAPHACSPVPANDPENKFYRFAVAEPVYGFLEKVGNWTRQWEVNLIDAVPVQMLNDSVSRRIMDRPRAVKLEGLKSDEGGKRTVGTSFRGRLPALRTGPDKGQTAESPETPPEQTPPQTSEPSNPDKQES